MKDLILSKTGNIGGLAGYLKKHTEVYEYLVKETNFLDDSHTISERVYYLANDIKEPLKCMCGDKRTFIGFKNGYRPTCGKKACYVEQRKITNFKKYGVENPQQNEEIKEKTKNTVKEKYGKHYMHNEKVRKKFNNTMKERYGVEWAQQNEDIHKKSLDKHQSKTEKEKKEITDKRLESFNSKTEQEKQEIIDKRINTLKEKYGEDYYTNYLQDKIKETSLEKYGVEHFLKSEKVTSKRVNSYKKNILEKYKSMLTNEEIVSVESNRNETDTYINIRCIDCGEETKITRQLFVKRHQSDDIKCLHCNPISSGYSMAEKEVLDFIKENYDGEIIENSRDIIEGYEIDIYLPEINLAIEYDGLYWHSELYKPKKYHQEKTQKCEDVGVQLIHLFEDEWLYKEDIVKSRLLNFLGTSKKIYARKTIVKEVTNNKLIRKFIDENHIQGFIGSKVKIGLFLDDELISIMTFGKQRRNLGSSVKDGDWELLRFCNERGITVVGGASKLFKYFIRNYDYNEIISFADRRWSNGNLYKQLGFVHSHNSDPSYFYFEKDLIRKNRFMFRKDVLVKDGFDPNKTEVEIMYERGYQRIFDSGAMKWEFK